MRLAFPIGHRGTEVQHKASDDFPEVTFLNTANPFTIFPDRFDGGKIARVENIPGGGHELALPEIMPGVAGADGHELQNAGIAVAIDHAPGAAVADELR